MEKTMKIVKVLGIFLLLTIGLKHQGYAQFPVFDSLLKAGKYNTIGEIRPGGFALTSNSRKGDFYLENGQKIVIQGYEPTQIRRGKYGYFHFEVNQKWGLTDSLFRVVIAPEYDGLAHIVTPEYFIVKKQGLEGLFHLSGKMIYPIEYKKIQALRKFPANAKIISLSEPPALTNPITWILADTDNHTWFHAGEKKWRIPIQNTDSPLFVQLGQLLLSNPRQKSSFNNNEEINAFSFTEMLRVAQDSIQYLYSDESSEEQRWENGVLTVNNQPLDTAGNLLLPYKVLNCDILSPEYISCMKEIEGIPQKKRPIEQQPTDENPIGTSICVKPQTKPTDWLKVIQLIRVKDKKVIHEIPVDGFYENHYYYHEQKIVCMHTGGGINIPDTLYALDEEGKHIRMRLDRGHDDRENNGLISVAENTKKVLYNFNLETNGIRYKKIGGYGDFLECEKGVYIYKNEDKFGVENKPIFLFRIMDFYGEGIQRKKRYFLFQHQEAHYTKNAENLSFLGFPTHRIRLHFNNGKTRVVKAGRLRETENGFWVWDKKNKKESVFDKEGNYLVDEAKLPENDIWSKHQKTHKYTLSGYQIQKKARTFVKENGKWYAKDGNTLVEIPENYDSYIVLNDEGAVTLSHKDPISYSFKYLNLIGAVDTSGKEILPPVFQAIYSTGKWWIVKKSEKEYELRDSLFRPISGGQYEYIQPIMENALMIMKKDGKAGLFSKDLQPKIPADYDVIIPEGVQYRNGYYLLKKDGKMGLANKEFKLQIPVKYDSIIKISPYTARHFPPEHPFVYVAKIPEKDRLSIYTESGTLISNGEYSNAQSSINEPILGVTKHKKKKYIHAETGKEIYRGRVWWFYSVEEKKHRKQVKTQWGRKILSCSNHTDLKEIGEWLVVSKGKKRFEIMDSTGKVRFAHKGVLKEYRTNNNFYSVELNDKFALLDLRNFKIGEFIFDKLDLMEYNDSPAFWAYTEGKGRFIDANTGEWLTEPEPYTKTNTLVKGCNYPCNQSIFVRYDSVKLMDRETTQVGNKETGYQYVTTKVLDLNTTQSVISPFQYIGAVKHNLAPVSDGKKVGIMNHESRLVLPLEWDNVEILDTNFLAAFKDCKWAVYDRLGKEIHPLSFDVLMKEDEFPVFYFEFNKNSGYLNAKGENLFGVSLDSVIKGENIELFKDNKTGLGNYKGEILLPVIYDKIEQARYKEDFVLTLNGKKGIWNHEKGELLPCVYDDIRLDGSDYILTLSGKQGVYFPVNGVLISPEYNAVSSESRSFISSEKFYLLKKEEGTRIADEAGKVIFLHTFSEVDFFPKENRISVVLGGKRYNGIKVVDKWRLFEVKTGG